MPTQLLSRTVRLYASAALHLRKLLPGRIWSYTAGAARTMFNLLRARKQFGARCCFGAPIPAGASRRAPTPWSLPASLSQGLRRASWRRSRDSRNSPREFGVASACRSQRGSASPNFLPAPPPTLCPWECSRAASCFLGDRRIASRTRLAFHAKGNAGELQRREWRNANPRAIRGDSGKRGRTHHPLRRL